MSSTSYQICKVSSLDSNNCVVTTQEYETELEGENSNLDAENKKLRNQITELEKIAVQSDKNRAELRQEVRDIEAKLDKSNSANQKALDKGKNNSKKVVSLEIENEDLQNEIRRNQFIIEDLQLKFDT